MKAGTAIPSMWHRLRQGNGPWLPAGLGKIAILFHPQAEGEAVRRRDFAGF